MALFLDRDGGPREGAIRLLPEKIDTHPPIAEEESSPPSPIFEASERRSFAGTLRKKVSQKLSGYFAQRVRDAHAGGSSPSSPQPAVRLDRTRTFSTSRADGSAYGYSGSYRNRLASNATANFGMRRGSVTASMRRRRGSNVDGNRESFVTESGDLNFAQRLLMANENAVTNIADLWVAAAMNVDNEDPFESDTDMGSDREDDVFDLEQPMIDNDNDDSGVPTSPPGPGRRASRGQNVPSRRPSSGAHLSRPQPQLGSPRRPSGTRPINLRHTSSSSFNQYPEGTPTARRFSTTVPSIFAHPGVKIPPAVVDAQQLLLTRAEQEPLSPDALTTILESRRASRADAHGGDDDVEAAPELKPPTLSSQLPILIIIQYGLLALHTTTHDQVFLSYLVS